MNDVNDDLHDDDQPIGRLLGRREVLALFGSLGAGAAVIAGAGLAFGQEATALPEVTPEATASPVPSCVVRPALTEGPYFVDGALNRSDIRVEPSDGSVVAGTLLKLKFVVTDVTGGTCKPLPGAQVDVWQTNPIGFYEFYDYLPTSFNLGGRMHTDAAGRYQFTTLKPSPFKVDQKYLPAQIHFKVSYQDHQPLFPRLFFADDPYLANIPAAPDLAIRLSGQVGPAGPVWQGNFDVSLPVPPPVP